MEYRTTGYSGYAVKYSPFVNDRLAVATSANFGLVGNGRLYILGLTANGIILQKQYDTQDAIYDTAWSELNENQVVAGCGDGSVKLYDLSTPSNLPVQNWHEHAREVYATSWNLITKDTLATSSWDGTIKVWSPQRQSSILTLPTHSCTYSAAFSPHSPSIISSATSDSHIRVFDLRTPASASNHLVQLIPIHGSAPVPGSAFVANRPPPTQPAEALTHDWNKYRDTVIAVAGVDTVIRTFDLRNSRQPIAQLRGHEYAVRRLAWSPHLSDVLMSGSYDMSVKIWSDGTAVGSYGSHPGLRSARELGSMEAHTEFACGVDWCLFGAEGWVASASWDSRVLVWDVRTVMRPHSYTQN
ncbi:peroxisomal targeting signal 2 receptor [Stipitochalara longipes BDJ]|nr:peroxisomal targeting signal 2 receptor [Stipitochalara longipes BDJ]